MAMGALGGECDIWHWRASMDGDATGISEQIASLHPDMPPASELLNGAASGEEFLTATAAGNPLAVSATSGGVFNLQAGGIGTLTTQSSSTPTVQGKSRRHGQTWEVVFTRSIDPAIEGDVTFRPGAAVHIGLAVWDGSAGDRNGQKSFSIWHQLTLEQDLP